MKSILSILTILSITLILGTLGDDKKPHAGKSCKMLLADLTKRQLMGISKCVKAMNFKSGKEKSEKMTCVLKCVFSNEGVLNPEGYITKEAVTKLLEKEFPEHLRASAGAVFMHCTESTGHLVDPKEELCKSYDPLIKCFLGGLGKICPK